MRHLGRPGDDSRARKDVRARRSTKVGLLEYLENRWLCSGLDALRANAVIKGNVTPAASNDAYATTVSSALAVAAPGVLANDTDADGDRLSASLVAGPSHGTLTLNPSGSFAYTPAANYSGTDTFTYRAGDGQATSNTATVSLTVTPVNDAPAPPTLSATSVSSTRIDVSWTTVDGAIRYEIQRRATGSATWGDVPFADAGATIINDNGLTPETSYEYRVRAVTDNGTTDYSSPVTAMTETVAEDRQALEAAARAEADAYIMAQMDNMPHDDDPSMQAEHAAVLNLVPFESATAIAIIDGNWSDPDTWMGQTLPSPGARIWIMPGRTVTVDSVLDDSVATIRVTGTLRFAPDRNTRLEADTVVVDPDGTFIMGTDATPIDPHYVAQLVFISQAPTDRSWDPSQYSRGLISLGSATIHGAMVTPWLTLSRSPRAGDTTLVLNAAPVGWKPGDTLALAGTHYTGTSNTGLSDTEDERLTIASIDGTTVRLTSPVRFDHDVPTQDQLAAQYGQAPPGAPIADVVANLTRNARFESANPDVLEDRGHVMFMHSPLVEIVDAGFYGLGRTDKATRIGVNNPRGRYALHFHRTGPSGPAIVVDGVAVDGSPGWGIVNHSSDVDVTNSVVYGAVGAAFAAEAGDERGSFRGDLAIRSVGSPNDNVDLYVGRRDINDYGFNGHGFWLQSPTVALVGNVVAGAASMGIVYYPLDFSGDGGDLSAIPIAECRDNTVFASRRGLRLYGSAPSQMPNQIEGLTVWGTRYEGFGMDYSRNVELIGARFIGIGDPGVGATFLDGGARFTYRDSYVVGYGVGLDAGYGGHSEITGGYLNNEIDVRIVKNHLVGNTYWGTREVVISGVHFAGGGIAMQGGFNSDDSTIPFYTWFAPESITWDGRQLFYAEQAPGQVVHAPVSEIDGKTNAELTATLGLAYAGAIMPADASAVVGLTGGFVGSTRPVQPGPLFYVATYTVAGGQSAVVMWDTINQNYLFTTLDAGALQPGWNMIRATDSTGARRVSFRFVY
jgi:VCBS repeat-containing protein